MRFSDNPRAWIRALCVIVLVGLLTSCAGISPRTSIPGGTTYCLESVPSREFREQLKSSDWAYGPYDRHVIGGHSAICDLNRFYTLKIKWETKDGQKESLSFDLVEIMKKFRESVPEVNRTFRNFGSAQVRVRYFTDRITLSFNIAEVDEKGRSEKGIPLGRVYEYEYPILTHRLPSQAASEE